MYIRHGYKKLDYMMQGRLVSGEFQQSMKPGDGKTEQQWKTWIWLSELVLKAGNSFMSVTSRYYYDLNYSTVRKLLLVLIKY